MKGIIFLGDSYTWGQGLHYYGLFEETILPNKGDSTFNSNIMSDREIQFMCDNRFSNLVTKHFNTISIQRNKNGGSHQEMFQFLNNQDLTLYDTLIFQLTDVFRDKIFYEYNGDAYECSLSIHQNVVPAIYTKFIEYLDEKFDGSLEKFKDYYITKLITNIKDKFLQLEKEFKYKCYLHTWQPDVIDYIKNDVYLNKKFIQYEYNNIKYDCIYDMATVTNPELIITHDPFFKEKKINVFDGHIGLKAQTIIANSIIHKIVQDNIIQNIKK
jgi:hypothetical protein